MKALIVDDERNILELLSILLGEYGISADKVSSYKEAKDLIEENIYDLALLDLRLPDGSGIDILKKIKEKNSKTEVIIITAFASSETAVEAIKLGAYDYLSKPFNINDLRLVIRNVKDKIELEKKICTEETEKFEGLAGKSPAIQNVKETIKKIAPYDINVLIVGESGTGKEVVAKTIHRLSNRKDKAFIAINCASLPSDLLESELFGYKKGAFTGAVSDKKGLIEEANGGTLFLDEIGEMPMPLQAKLLRFLEEQKIRPLGSTKEVKVDVRIISATNRDLEKEIKNGNFREDLYYRLGTIIIKMPSLRERKEDIPLLAEQILKEIKAKYNKNITRISPEFMRYLISYDYKGNIRELKNILEKAVILSEGEELNFIPTFSEKFNSIYIDNPNDEFTVKSFPEEGVDLKEVLSNIEKALLLKGLEKAGGVKTKAAEILGLTFREFRYRLSKYKDQEIEDTGA
ncbi:sigma-54-dependent transcriptional regulator [Persephonella sp.]